MLPMTIGALGIVYGDIGTSPLYSIRETFAEVHRVPVTRSSILGVLSLIFWSLIVVITVKYVSVVLRADNHGEGGILALTALVAPTEESRRRRNWLVLAGLFGAALLYGDGAITPAISVLSAVEGVESRRSGAVTVRRADGNRHPRRALFHSATGKRSSRPLLWTGDGRLVCGAGGARDRPYHRSSIGTGRRQPAVCDQILHSNSHSRAFIALGGVVLVITGGEALYADLGHFGAAPIKRGWFAVVLPALLLNYFGQGAMLLADPEAVRNPFFLLAPEWAIYPLVGLATARHRDRLSGADLGGVLADPSGDPTWVHSAHGGSSHLGGCPWTGLSAGGELGPAGCMCWIGVGVWQLGEPGRCLRDRGDGHDDHHQPFDRSRSLRSIGGGAAGRLVAVIGVFLLDRPGVPRGQRDQDSRMEVGSPSWRRRWSST